MKRASSSRRMLAPLVLLASILLLQGCGGGGGGQGATSAPLAQKARGAAIKGPLDGAQVRLFAIDDAGFATGPALATVVTDAEGRFSFERAADGPALIAITSGGSFVDESDTASPDQRRRIVLGAQDGFESILPAGSSSLVITPYTHARLLQVRRAANGENFLGFFAAARAASVAAFGYDPYEVLPESPLAPAADADEAAIQYAMAIGGAAYVIQAQSLALGTIPTYATVRAFIDDLSDGRVDGRLDGAPIFVAVDGRMLALPDSVSLNGQLLRFVNNNFDLYGGRAAARVDEDQLTQVPAPGNRSPQASADAYETEAGTALAIAAPGVLGNDGDPDGDPLTALIDATPDNGTLSLSADGGFVYMPAEGFSGTDRFTYRASDGELSSMSTTVTLVVGEAAGTAPVAVADDYRLDEDVPLGVAAPGVLTNDLGMAEVALRANLVASTSRGQLTLSADGSFTYQPEADFNGEDSFRYRAANEFGESGEVTVRLSVDPVNDRPVAVADRYSTGEEQELLLPARGVLTNDTDVDGDVLRALLVDGPDNGTLELGEDGALRYSPGPGFNGTDSFDYRADDGGLQSAPVRVTISVASDNDAPDAAADVYTTPEDQALVVAAPGVLDNDTDAEGDSLGATLVTAPQHGVVALSANGGFTYTPVADYVGEDQFSYQASDGNAQSSPATVMISVTAVNDAPLAADDRYATEEDAPLEVTAPGLLANDSDDGPVLSTVLVEGPQHGQLTLAADGGFSYLPQLDYTGPDQFTYRAEDGERASEPATVRITVGPVGDPPVAGNDAYGANEGQTLTIAAPGVLDNDSDADDNALTAVLVQGPANGALALSPGGGFSYTHNGSETSSDSFVYRAEDGVSQSANATVTLAITPVNDVPVANADAYSTNEDTSLLVPARGVLLNDVDPDSITLTAVLEQAPTRGVLSLSANGGFTYTPQADVSGPDSFTYRASDGSAQSAPVAVTINVAAVNDAPLGVLDQYDGSEDSVLTVAAPGVLANDADPEGSALTAVLASAPAQGALNLSANGGFSYTPAANFAGNLSFTYRARDAAGVLSAPVTVNLGIAPVNDAPVAPGDSYNATEDTLLTVSAPGVLGNDTDADGPVLSAVLVAPPATGTLNLAANGGFTYMPAAHANGVVTFTYRASDGTAQSNLATVTITIAAVNDVPVADDDGYNATEDTALVVAAASGVLIGDTDADGPPMTAVLVTPPATGTLNLAANGGFTYTPVANANGAVSFTYRASDGAAQSNTATVTITIAAVNDAPVADDDSYNATEDTALVVAAASGVLIGDTDADGQALTAVLITSPATGTLNLAANGGFSYTPAANVTGAVTFTYRASDGTVQSNLATVTITIAAVNDAPVAADDTYQTEEAMGLAVNAANGVLGNDSDPDGVAPTTAVLVSDVAPAAGTLVFNSNGSFSFEPAGSFTGDATFTYRARDAALAESNLATVTIEVLVAPNEAPLANNDVYSTDEDTALEIATDSLNTVVENDTDADDDPLTAQLVTNVASGTLSFASDGSFNYTPATNFNGPVTFTYRANDGTVNSNVATVTITVTAVNDKPTVVVNDGIAVGDAQAFTLTTAELLAADVDHALSDLTYAIVDAPDNGKIQRNGSDTGSFTATQLANGEVTYLADDGEGTSDSFTFTVSDTAGGVTAVTPFDLTILRNNDAPQVSVPSSPPSGGLFSGSLPLTGIGDVDAFNGTLTLQITSTANTDLDIDTGIVGGITGDQVTGGGTNALTINSSLDQISTTISGGGFVYANNSLKLGSRSFDFTLDDNGNSGLGGAKQDMQSASIDIDTIPIPDGTDPSGIALTGAVNGDQAGYSVAGIGDFNADGIDDFAIGAPQFLKNTGKVYIVYGKNGALSDVNLATFTGSDGVVLTGTDTIEEAGTSVSGAGDFNGDGVDDIIIGAPSSRPGGRTRAGRAYIVYGSAAPPATIALSALTDATGLIVEGVSAEDGLGISVSGAGSLNGDSFDDVIIGTFGASPNGAGSGIAYVVLGRASGVGLTLDPSTLDGTDGFAVYGLAADDRLGQSVAGVGDFNDDARPDVLIGIPGADSGNGRAAVVFGDVSFPAVVSLNALDGGNGLQLIGPAGAGRVGTSAAAAGDLDNDGIDDLVLGAPNSNSADGRAYVVFGANGGFAGTLNLGTLNGGNGFVFIGVPGVQNFSGEVVSGAGDLDSDGFDDVIIGAQSALFGDVDEGGGASVLFGSASIGAGGTVQGNALNGSNGAYIRGLEESFNAVSAVGAAGDVNDDGIADILIGARVFPVPGKPNAGSAFVITGRDLR